MDISYAHDHGLTASIHITPDELAILGEDVHVVDQVRHTIAALLALRTGTVDDHVEAAIGAASEMERTIARSAGILDALIRRWPGSHGQLATATGVVRATAQSRRRALQGRPASEWERWATTGAAQVSASTVNVVTGDARVGVQMPTSSHHHGVEFTHPDVFAAAAAGAGWADPETDPTRIDWAERQARAAIPFTVIDGRPVTPGPRTAIRYGRGELGHWGEQLCADAIVTSDHAGHRWLLMIRRGDGHGWALPGGYVDQGETTGEAAIRELAEETGLSVPGGRWTSLPPRVVPDPRGTDESWMVTVPVMTHLGTLETLPPVRGADDAGEARWVRADDWAGLLGALPGVVFPAHREMLRDALDRA